MLDRDCTTTVIVGLCMLLACGDANARATRHVKTSSTAPDAAQSGWSRQRKPAIASDAAPNQVAGANRAGSETPMLGTRRTAAPALKIALLGDQGVGGDARAVLQLIAEERADALIHLGDFAYADATPQGWDAQLTGVLGADFPVFAAIGNHDVTDWSSPSGFRAQLLARLERVPEAHCSGDYGVNASCTFRGLFFVLSGVGTYGSGHEAYLESALSKSDAAFRLCIWHKNQHDMQVGAKTDEVGWEAYRICARHGVPIITGHEHSYARSFVLTALGDSAHGHGALAADPAHLELAPGRSFVTVAGLGGESQRTRTPDHASDTWWATIYARDYQMLNAELQSTASDIQYGALFIEIGMDGDPGAARAYFKTTERQSRDEFTIRMQL